MKIKFLKYILAGLFLSTLGQIAFAQCGRLALNPTTGLMDCIGPAGGGSGTVTSVALSLPGIFTVSGSPVTTSGTLAASFVSQNQNLVLVSPNGSSGSPSFRALVSADLPSLTSGSSILYGNGSGGFSNATIGSGLSFAGGTLSATGGGGCTVAGSSGDLQANNGSGGCAAANLNKNADGTTTSSKAITWASPVSPTFNSGGTTTCDWSAGNVCKVTFSGGNTTLAFSNPHGSGPYRLISILDTGGRTYTFPGAVIGGSQPQGGTDDITIQDYTFDGTNYNAATASCPTCAPGLVLPGSSSGATTVQAAAAASGTLTLPAATDTLMGRATTDILTNKTVDTATNTVKVAGTTVTGAQGSTGTKIQMSTGTTTANDCMKFDANGNAVDAGAACGGNTQYQVSGSNIGAAVGGANFIPSTGVLVTGANSGTVFSATIAADTAVLETRNTLQSGVDLYVATASASSTTYTGCPSPTTAVAYSTGMVVNLIPDVNGAGGATTFNLCSLGAKTLKEADGITNPTSSDITAGQRYAIWYDGTQFRLPANAGSGTGANTALSNLSSVSINTPLLFQTSTDLGSTTKPVRNLYLSGTGTYGTNYIELTGAPSSTRVITLPDTTDTLVGKATTDTLTNKTYDTAGTGNTFKINGTTISAVSGTGAVCLASGSSCAGGAGLVYSANASYISNGISDNFGNNFSSASANQVYCQVQEVAGSGTSASIGVKFQSGGLPSTKGFQFGIYSTSGSRLAQLSTALVGTLSFSQTASLAYAFTPGTYYVCISAEAASTGMSTVGASTDFADALNSGSVTPRIFLATNAGSGTGSSYTLPATLGSITSANAASINFPVYWILF